MRALLAAVLTALFVFPAFAQPEVPGWRPVRVPGGPTEEQRMVGADFPSWQITQALGTTTEAIRLGGTGVPICIGWEALIATRADQAACWCFSLDPNVRVAAPTADGGCRITDDYGRDGDGACWSSAANETRWKSPLWQVVARRPGARGYPGNTGGGVCTVATSTTVGMGSALRVPCRVTSDCTTIVGSGTCEDFTALATDHPRRAEEQYRRGCTYLVATPAAAATAMVEGGR